MGFVGIRPGKRAWTVPFCKAARWRRAAGKPPVDAMPLGVIAGTGWDFPEGYLFAPLFRGAPHDGRVAVAATRFDGMADFVTVPHGHRALHTKADTATLVLRFMAAGRF